jgi:hypothetical protein
VTVGLGCYFQSLRTLSTSSISAMLVYAVRDVDWKMFVVLRWVVIDKWRCFIKMNKCVYLVVWTVYYGVIYCPFIS